MKRAISFVLSLIMVVGICTGTPLLVVSKATYSDCFEYVWNSDGESLSIMECDVSVTGKLEIPAFHDGVPVTGIDEYAFEYCSNLVSIVLPESITTIGAKAFYYCSKLETIEMLGDVTNIGDYAFEKCKNLKVFTFSNDIQEIGCGAFWGCSSLESVVIPDSITAIGGNAFYSCTNLSEIIIPDTIEDVGYCTFVDTGYYNNTDNWEDGVLYIGNHLIEANHSVPMDYSIKDGTKTIAPSAFGGNLNLKTVFIPESVVSIGKEAFARVNNLTEINVSSNNLMYSDIDGVLFNKDKTILISYPLGKVNSSYEVPQTVETIEFACFRYCNFIESIFIPDSVTFIDHGAFSYCENLNNIDFPKSVTNINSRMIYGSSFYNNEENWENGVLYINNQLVKAKDISGAYAIKQGTESISSEAFSNCSNLACIMLPESLKTIHENAFLYCDSLNTVYVDSIENWCNIEFAESYGDSANPLRYAESFFVNGELLTQVEIPMGIKKIPDYTFCSFDITELNIPDNVKEIGKYAFKNCENLTTVVIPKSVSKIKYGAFDGCENLKHVFYDGTEDDWDNIEIEACNVNLTKYVHFSLDHISSSWITDNQGSCTENGSKHKECTVCKEVLETETIYAPGHSCSDWITDKNATVDGAGSKHKECTVCKIVLETETIPQLKCSEPKLTKIENASNGIKITWSKESGAQSYNVYRKTYSNGKWSGWSEIKTGVTSTSYIDTTVKSGVYYLYTVRAKNAAGLSSYNPTGLKIKFLLTPKFTSLSNGSGKTTLKWNKVTGASGYYIYRQTYSNSKWSGWKKVAATKNNYYNDTKVSGGNYYKYTVRAYSGNYTSYYNTSGVQIKYLAAAKISSASSRKDGILINWKKISGASGYYVYRKAPSGDWKKIATVKDNTKIKYLDETPRKGVTYQYCVKAYSGKYTGAYANTYKIKCKY